MDDPNKPTFKLSLLDCIVAMLTMSVLLSLNVYAFQDTQRLQLGNWWSGRSPVDGIVFLLIFNIFIVMFVVVSVRVLVTLWKQRRAMQDSRRSEGEK